jgi:esterase/lipase
MKLFLTTIKIYLSLVFLTIGLISCKNIKKTRPAETPVAEFNAVIKFPKPCQKIKAVAVILHGLNFKPEKMDDWVTLLNGNGSITMRFSLYGHEGRLSNMKRVNENIWRNQFDNGMKQARVLADKHHVPLIFLGYSLGGLIGVEWISRKNLLEKSFDKMVLLAPAIATPWFSETAKRLLSFFDNKTILFTSSPKGIRANKGSSVGAYRALFAFKSSLESRKFNNANIDTLVILDPYDELIPYDEIKNIIKNNRLSRWHLEAINNQYAKKNYGFRHMIADRISVGDVMWKEISDKVLKHFNL